MEDDITKQLDHEPENGIEGIQEVGEKPSLSPQKIRTIALAVTIGLFLCWAMLGGSGPKHHQQLPQNISAESFPRGNSGLKDSSAAADRVAAISNTIKDRNKEQAKEDAKLVESRSRLSKNVAHSEIKSEIKPNSDTAVKSAEVLEPATSKKGTPESKTIPLTAKTPFERIGGKLSLPLAAHKDQNGDTWVAHSKGVMSYRKNGTTKSALDRPTYDAEFNEDLPPATAITSSPETGALWVGFADGQLMKYQRYEWQRTIDSDTTSRGRVRALTIFNKDLFIGGKGLYKWSKTASGLVADPNFRNTIINSFAKHDNTLILGGQGGLFRFNDDSEQSWTRIWKVTKRDVMVRATYVDHDGSFLLGTYNGVTRVSPKGVVVERFLENIPVSDLIAEKDGKLWVATNKHGLKYYDGEQWYSAAKEEGLTRRINWLTTDEQSLQIGVAGSGVLHAPIDAARKWITQYPEIKDQGTKPQLFGSLCDAADSLLKGVTVSGNIAIEEIDGVNHVFIDGQKYCPKGLGYRRADGAIALLSGWAATFYHDGVRKELAIPESIAADKVSALMLDSKNRLWMGTPDNGLAYFVDEKTWQHFSDDKELVNNPIKSMSEDDRGNIWVGTIPPYDKKQQSYDQSNLHLFNDKGWFHYDPRNGLAQISTHSLAVTKDGSLVVGTHGGFSLITPEAEVTSYGPKQGMDPYFIYSATVDRQGGIWFAHQYFGKGATKFDGKAFYRFDSSIGLFNDRLLKVAKDRSGRSWFLASNGQVGVYPGSLLKQLMFKQEIPSRTVRTLKMYP